MSLVTMQTHRLSMTKIINPERYSSLHRLFRVTALVLKFISRLRGRVSGVESQSPSDAILTRSDLHEARLSWIKDSQSHLQEDKKFPTLKCQLNLFTDIDGVWRCGGRMSNSCLSLSEQNPIVLDRRDHLAELLVMDAHKRVLHNGIREMLTKLRSRYRLVRRRQFVWKILHKCIVCRKTEGSHCQGIPPPPLPEFRVRPSRPFQTTGVDLAGPLYMKASTSVGSSKVWLCLYTCCATRAVHLDLVPDMTATSFLSFKRFSARRGTPSRVLSDNAKTFKSAATILQNTSESPEVQKYFSQFHVEWRFNLEKSLWQGGIFERMIKSAKRCLKKTI